MSNSREEDQKVMRYRIAIVPLLSSLTAILVAAFPALFLYLNNVDEADLPEVLPLLFVFSAVGLILLGIAGVVTRSWSKAALISVVFSVILLNFAILEKLLTWVVSSLKYWHVVPILLVLALHIAWFIHKKLSPETAKIAVNILCLVVGVLILFNCVIAAPNIVKKLQVQHRQQEQQDQLSITAGAAEQDLPNIYLIIFDEYANFRQIEKYYNYDNSELKNFLTAHNFNISYNSRNESIMTSTVLTNLANLDYVVTNYTSEIEKKELRHNGKLFSLIREKGYQVQAADQEDFFGQESTVKRNKKSFAVTATGENITDMGLFQTVIYPIYKIDTSPLIQHITKIVDTVSNKNFIPTAPTFSVIYLVFPHVPFLVDEYGNSLDATQAENWENDSIYLGQYKYATKLMLRMLNNLIENDPDSIILLQSDHGARATSNDEYFLKKVPLEIMENNLNAVYYRGENFEEIIDQSSVNTMRLVLSKLFHLNWSTVEVPQDTYKYK